MITLHTFKIRTEQDIFAVRQLGRAVVRAVGMGEQDQTRVPTALSEVARLVLAAGHPTHVVFAVSPDRVPVLRIELAHPVPGDKARLAPLLEQVGRLVDTMEVDDGATGTVVRMSRRLPPGAAELTAERTEEIRASLSGRADGTPFDELALQNQQLVAVLSEVRAQRDELARLNAELEETNRGVMALYTQLSDELEETNRGVVALYAELDEKSVQLRAANEAKSRFLANVSHELRAPVTAIIGLGRLLADDSSDPLTTDQGRQVELIRSSATDLLTLVNDLLDLAKAEAGRIEPVLTDVDLRALFGQLRGTLRPMATRPEVELVVDEPDVPVLHTDEALLARVLRNLLTNALKFTAEGTIRMSTAAAGDDVEITVSDTGTGIPADQLDRIFEEFYQVPGSKALSGKGTGLGLPYARRLVTTLGGAMRVTSTVGEGSTFIVVLPRGAS